MTTKNYCQDVINHALLSGEHLIDSVDAMQENWCKYLHIFPIFLQYHNDKERRGGLRLLHRTVDVQICDV